MILARLAQAIRRQDWFQVLIEVLIVIVGIFLGLQVQAAYEGKQAEDEEARVIGYLISDLEETIEYLDYRVIRTGEQIELTFKILDILESGKLRPEDVPDFEEGILRLGRAQPADAYINSFSDDNLNRILDDDMRNIIGDFRGWLRRANDIAVSNIDSITIMEEITFLKTPVQQTLDGDALIYYDFETLKDDHEYRAALISINGSVL